ncbi:hypothetical protein [Methylobacterium trifolii]|uniref:hypothetical protein n=1 Tax=Methylobacterium trifolii TaxID=1003092 RepID=UPI001EDD7ECA|nr:hypothetical protein [Methylobacterium trifolii]
MTETSDLEAVAEACLSANEVVSEHGTPEMQALMRTLLFMVGREIAAQSSQADVLEPEEVEKRLRVVRR